jgi:hypothetical protein
VLASARWLYIISLGGATLNAVAQHERLLNSTRAEGTAQRRLVVPYAGSSVHGKARMAEASLSECARAKIVGWTYPSWCVDSVSLPSSSPPSLTMLYLRTAPSVVAFAFNVPDGSGRAHLLHSTPTLNPSWAAFCQIQLGFYYIVQRNWPRLD